MHDSPPLVSGALRLLFRHFSQRQEVLQAFKQVQLLVSDSDVESYKQIKTDLDGLRLLVEKSELWVYKAKNTANTGEGEEGSGDPVVSSTSKILQLDTIDQDDDGPNHILENNNLPGKKTTSRSQRSKLTAVDKQGSAIDLDIGPPLDESQTNNYKQIQQILTRMNRLCIQPVLSTIPSAGSSSNASSAPPRPRKHEQRLLRNMVRNV